MSDIKTEVLIQMLDEIDSKLRNRTYQEPQKILHRDHLEFTTITRQKYSTVEIMSFYNRKQEIITALHGRGVIEDDEMAKYYLSENGEFTPKLKL